MTTISDPRANDFKHQIKKLFFTDMHRMEPNNYDSYRYGFDGVDRSNIFDVDKHIRYHEWFDEHYADVFRFWERLADQESRDLLVGLVRYRMAGHLHVRIPGARLSLLDAMARIPAETPSGFAANGMFGNLITYDFDWQGTHYVVDSVKGAMVTSLVNGQYFFDRGGVRIAPERGDVVIDGGAFTGDTSVIFAQAVGPGGHVYAFDPLQAHVDICRHNFARPGYENTTMVGAGLADRTVSAPPMPGGVYNPGLSITNASTGTVPLVRVDDLLLDGSIPRVDFIKLDVEGSELAALRGSLAAIHKYRPKLAISLYHKPDDYFELSDFVHDLGLGYRMYLDHHTIYEEETVLYATAR